MRQQKQSVLIALVGLSVVLGIAEALLALPLSGSGERLAFTLVSNVALLVLGFRWLQLDAAELDIRRPTWLNIGIVMFAAAFVPYYLYKTRPAGHRLPAIAGFFALVFACMLASAIGASLTATLGGAPATSPGM